MKPKYGVFIAVGFKLALISGRKKGTSKKREDSLLVLTTNARNSSSKKKPSKVNELCFKVIS